MLLKWSGGMPEVGHHSLTLDGRVWKGVSAAVMKFAEMARSFGFVKKARCHEGVWGARKLIKGEVVIPAKPESTRIARRYCF